MTSFLLRILNNRHSNRFALRLRTSALPHFRTSALPHLALGTWHLALGTWHLALGTWHLALGTSVENGPPEVRRAVHLPAPARKVRQFAAVRTLGRPK